MTSRPPSVILNPKSRHTATLIFLHGLGDTGHGWAAAMNSIRPDFLKIVCPTAPSIPVTLNMGMRMPAWYDIRTLDKTDDPSQREDIKGVMESADYLSQLIKGMKIYLSIAFDDGFYFIFNNQMKMVLIFINIHVNSPIFM